MKVVSLAPSNSFIIKELGKEQLIVAATAYCKKFLSKKVAEKIIIVGGYTKQDIEKIIRLDADLYITSTFLQENLAEKLREKGKNVLHLDVRTLKDIIKSYEIIGKELNAKEKSAEIKENMIEKLKELKEKTKGLKSKKVYCEEFNNPVFASGNWIPGILKVINCKSFLKEGEPSRTFKLEELKAFNPEVIILHWCGFGNRINCKEVYERQGWQSIKAVKENRVYAINDDYLNMPCSIVVKGAFLMAEKIHEKVF